MIRVKFSAIPVTYPVVFSTSSLFAFAHIITSSGALPPTKINWTEKYLGAIWLQVIENPTQRLKHYWNILAHVFKKSRGMGELKVGLNLWLINITNGCSFCLFDLPFMEPNFISLSFQYSW